jgi:uncharacterized protein (TIGR03435 family)
MAKMRSVLLVSLAVTVGIGAVLHAQSPSFEVASVRVNKSGEPQAGPPFQPGGRVTLTNRTLRYLVQFAYSTIDAPLRELEIVGGPDWADRDRFDIVAKMPGSPPPEPATANLARVMLRTLLAERFQLNIRKQPRDLPVYTLVPARSDGRIGQGLRRRSEPNCDWFVPGRGMPDPAGPAPLCGYLRGGQGTLAFRGVTIARLASSLPLDRLVVDHTQLTGLFDVDLAWSAETGGGVANDGPSLFTAVQEQLGLKLEPKRAAVDVLVIESAEQPTPD